MRDIKTGKRVLIYSHDTFGLGHLRRCRTIAHHLVERDPDVSILIITGSPIIGSFGFRPHVDFVRVPGVIKLNHGDYTSDSLPIEFDEVLSIRASIIQHTAIAFNPDVLIVDKEPLGLRGEMTETLKVLKDMGTKIVLGLRDVMDEPARLQKEWDRKNVEWALLDIYDEIWAYGLKDIWAPLDGVGLSPEVCNKIKYTGYLRREMPSVVRPESLKPEGIEEPYLLITTGGGGDGASMVDWVISAYEQKPDIPHNALIIFGPFMAQNDQAAFMERVKNIPQLTAITFDAQIESLVGNAMGIVSMGGYNSFCETLSFDKPALIVPRTEPRLEQYIRTSQAEKLGLVSMLDDRGGRDPLVMAEAIAKLPSNPKPSETCIPNLLNGLESIEQLMDELFESSHLMPVLKKVEAVQ